MKRILTRKQKKNLLPVPTMKITNFPAIMIKLIFLFLDDQTETIPKTTIKSAQLSILKPLPHLKQFATTSETMTFMSTKDIISTVTSTSSTTNLSTAIALPISSTSTTKFRHQLNFSTQKFLKPLLNLRFQKNTAPKSKLA